MKLGTLNHMKTKRLKLRLKIPLYQAGGILEGLWQLAGESADDGVVGRFNDEEIAAYLEWERDPSELIEALLHCGWLDRNEAGKLVIHDWLEHCPAYIRDRLRKRATAQGEIPRSDHHFSENEAGGSQNSAKSPPPTNPPTIGTHPTTTNSVVGACAGLGRGDLETTSTVLDWAFKPKRSKRRPLEDCRANRLRVLGAAERALEQGKSPGALFSSIVTREQWDVISAAQMDRAKERLREHEARGPPAAVLDLIGQFAKAVNLGD